jgi:hypothetical protein
MPVTPASLSSVQCSAGRRHSAGLLVVTLSIKPVTN